MQPVPAFLASLFGRRFWLTGYLAIFLGILCPWDLGRLRPLIPVLLASVLFATCLKVRLAAVGCQLAKGRALVRIGLLSTLKLALLPWLVFALAAWLCPAWAAGLFLVALMPAGMTSAAFTDVARGNVALALVMILATSLLCPFTIPVFLGWGEQALGHPGSRLAFVPVLQQALFLCGMLLIPFTAAQVVRRLASAWVERHHTRFTAVALAANAFLLFVATAATRHAWSTEPASLVTPLIACTVMSLLFLAIGRTIRACIPAPDAVAFACNTIYMNNTLALVFALAFFTQRPDLVLPPIIMGLPMVAAVALAGPVIGRGRNTMSATDANNRTWTDGGTDAAVP